MKIRPLIISKVGLFVLISTIVMILIYSSNYYISFAAVGSGGQGGGAGTVPQHGLRFRTDYGYGWREFDVNGPIPKYMQHASISGLTVNADVNYIRNACRKDNANKLVAFVVMRVANNEAIDEAAMYNDVVWDVGSTPGLRPRNNADRGAGWIDRAEARRRFNLLPSSQKSGWIPPGYSSSPGATKYTSWFCYSDIQWTVSADTKIRKNNGSLSASNINARLGDSLDWVHNLRNHGPSFINKNMTFNIDHAIVPMGANPSVQHTSPLNAPVYEKRPNITLITRRHNINNGRDRVMHSDVGKRLCQRIAWTPHSSNSQHYGHSQWVCADIVHEYSLDPVIDFSPAPLSEDQSSVNVVSRISNLGPTKSKIIAYATVRFVIKGSAPQSSYDTVYNIPSNSSAPGDLVGDWDCRAARHFANKYGLVMSQCASDSAGLPKDGGSSAAYVDANISKTVFNGPNLVRHLGLRTGDSLCYATTVSRYTHNAPGDSFRYAIKCARIAKKPKVQIWGGDVRTGSQAITSRTETSISGATRSYGSWAEYGIIANNDVRSASGAGLSSGAAGRSSAEPTRLTFANIGVSTPGNFTNQPFSTVVQVPPVPPAGAAVLAGTKSVAQLQGGYTATNLRLDGGEIPAGRRIVIRASGTVTVTGDIRYTAARLSNAKDIPQLVIVAKQIIIEPQVERVDAWLMTTHNGSISTCGAATGNQPAHGLNVAACAKQLRINGPIHTSKLYLRRTYGAENKPPMHFGTPAEILNLRPDAYLWGHGTAFTTGAIRTMYVKELPPRL